MIDVHIVWAIEINRERTSTVMEFHLRPLLVTLDESEAKNYAIGAGATTVQTVRIPTPDGWDAARDEIAE
jgi:hypothetical protein